MKSNNEALNGELTDRVSVTDYLPQGEIWTDAFQKSLNEHQIVFIPKKESPYIIDKAIIVPSNRHIIAEDGAVIRLADGVKTIMLRNENTQDGTHHKINSDKRDRNITIEGGVWEEWCTYRLGYGNSGMYDENRSFFGVSTCMLFNNIDNLTLKNMHFRHCGGFAAQIGDAKNVVNENILFEKCFADGIHVNGNVENVYINDVRGQVGDDLVALNVYDWLNSSIDFGPGKNILCRNLELFKDSHYKAIRIQPGMYYYDDGTEVECSLENVVFQNVKGIKTFKLYTQTPPYKVGQSPEKTGVAGGDNIIFENVEAILDGPIDKLGGYMTNDPITGTFAVFEMGMNLKNMYLKDISLTIDKEKHPYAYLLSVGPKSVREGDMEYFDPYLSSTVNNVYLENIKINGKEEKELSPYIREIEFNQLYKDMESTAFGKIENVITKK